VSRISRKPINALTQPPIPHLPIPSPPLPTVPPVLINARTVAAFPSPPPSPTPDPPHQVSRITRESINALKACAADEMTRDDWRLVIRLRKLFGVD